VLLLPLKFPFHFNPLISCSVTFEVMNGGEEEEDAQAWKGSS
jgi:hypothetical protein